MCQLAARRDGRDGCFGGQSLAARRTRAADRRARGGRTHVLAAMGERIAVALHEMLAARLSILGSIGRSAPSSTLPLIDMFDTLGRMVALPVNSIAALAFRLNQVQSFEPKMTLPNADRRCTDPSLGERYVVRPPSPGALLGGAGIAGMDAADVDRALIHSVMWGSGATAVGRGVAQDRLAL